MRNYNDNCRFCFNSEFKAMTFKDSETSECESESHCNGWDVSMNCKRWLSSLSDLILLQYLVHKKLYQ